MAVDTEAVATDGAAQTLDFGSGAAMTGTFPKDATLGLFFFELSSFLFFL